MANTQSQTYAPALLKARADLAERNPQGIARSAAVRYLRDEAGAGRFRVPL